MKYVEKMSSKISTIDTALAPAELPDLLNFIHQYYILSSPELFRFSWKGTVDKQATLSFRALDPEGLWWVDVNVRATSPIQVEMRPSSGIVQQEAMDRLRDDLDVTVQLYEEKIRKTTLYFAWVKGEKIVPETIPSMKRRSLNKLFRGNMIVMYVISIAISIALFSILGWYAAIAMVGFQLATVLLADRIVLKLGNWKIDSKNPYVHLLQYHIPIEDFCSRNRTHLRTSWGSLLEVWFSMRT
jgi:heat shock protein HtpX